MYKQHSISVYIYIYIFCIGPSVDKACADHVNALFVSERTSPATRYLEHIHVVVSCQDSLGAFIAINRRAIKSIFWSNPMAALKVLPAILLTLNTTGRIDEAECNTTEPV